MGRLYVQMEYDMEDGCLKVTDTNVKRAEVPGLLEEWLRGQIGRGEDRRKRVEKRKYTLRLEVDLTQDDFSMVADTNNHGLTAGIIAVAVRNNAIKYPQPPEQPAETAS